MRFFAPGKFNHYGEISFEAVVNQGTARQKEHRIGGLLGNGFVFLQHPASEQFCGIYCKLINIEPVMN